MPIGCCENGFGINQAVLYMQKAGLTKDQIVGAFQKAYPKGVFKGRHLAKTYLGEQK